MRRFHELLGAHADEPDEVMVATETDRGLFVGALVAAGYRVLAVNPMSTSRYRERHSTSGAKSDAGDAKVLAELARLDGHNHRPVAGDSHLVEAVKVLARAHHSMIWSRQRQQNQLRSTLREFFPAALVAQTDNLERELADRFEQHPDAKIIRSLPGLGMVLGARALAEFGDDPNRYADAKSRKNAAGTSPITRASGKQFVVLARYARNKHLADTCRMWAFAAITASPGARAFYDQRRAAGDTHNRALRALANRLVGILHGCIRHQTLYDEHIAWGHRVELAA